MTARYGLVLTLLISLAALSLLGLAMSCASDLSEEQDKADDMRWYVPAVQELRARISAVRQDRGAWPESDDDFEMLPLVVRVKVRGTYMELTIPHSDYSFELKKGGSDEAEYNFEIRSVVTPVQTIKVGP
jgi:hypothetical protein